MTFRLEIRHLLREALSELDGKEGTVLGLYYLEEFTMKRIGKILGIDESRVSQIHAAALRHLRSHLRRFHFFQPYSENGWELSSDRAKELALPV
jgi:DNA-directed RNA polymerase sigma subunit (sigma70/sigma32)